MVEEGQRGEGCFPCRLDSMAQSQSCNDTLLSVLLVILHEDVFSTISLNLIHKVHMEVRGCISTANLQRQPKLILANQSRHIFVASKPLGKKVIKKFNHLVLLQRPSMLRFAMQHSMHAFQFILFRSYCEFLNERRNQLTFNQFNHTKIHFIFQNSF